MFGVIAHVEFLVDPVLTQGGNHFGIGQQLFAEIDAFFPDLRLPARFTL